MVQQKAKVNICHSCHQTAGHNRYIKVASKFLENITMFKYIGTMVKK
jgi:hypothetical protein